MQIVLFAALALAADATELPMGEVLVTSDAPQLIAVADAPYPAMAERLGLEGTAELRMLVGADGRPSNVEVVRSSGHRALDVAAVRRAEDFRYRPARANGEVVASYAVMPMKFVLDGQDESIDGGVLVAAR